MVEKLVEVRWMLINIGFLARYIREAMDKPPFSFAFGTFWERSPSASSYRAEMLGLCSLHLFARALSEFYRFRSGKLPCAVTTKELSSIRIHPLEDTAQCKVRRCTKKSQSNKAHF